MTIYHRDLKTEMGLTILHPEPRYVTVLPSDYSSIWLVGSPYWPAISATAIIVNDADCGILVGPAGSHAGYSPETRLLVTGSLRFTTGWGKWPPGSAFKISLGKPGQPLG